MWIEIFQAFCIASLIPVTPFAGVWIEINILDIISIIIRRHSLRGSVDWNITPDKPSAISCVTPFAGVWIEISLETLTISPCTSHSLRGSVDWNQNYLIKSGYIERHSLRGSVDWNWQLPAYVFIKHGHSLRGSVDWNIKSSINKPLCTCVTPFAGVWIEITSARAKSNTSSGHSLRGSVDWNVYIIIFTTHAEVTPFAGVWIEI